MPQDYKSISDEELQKRYETSSGKKYAGTETSPENKVIGSGFAPADTPEKPLWDSSIPQSLRLASAATGGAMGLEAGPVGIAGGAGLGYMFPPTDAKQLALLGAGYGASQIAEPLMATIPELGGMGNGWLRTALRGVLGGIQEKAINEPIRSAFGEKDPKNNFSLAASIGLPMLAGAVANKTQLGPGSSRYNTIQSIKQMKPLADGGPEAAFDNLQQQHAQVGAGKAAQVVPEAGPIQQEVAGAKSQVQQAAQANLQTADQKKVALAAMPSGSADSDLTQKSAYLAANETDRQKWLKLTQGFAPDPTKQQLKTLLSQRDEAELQVGWNPFAKDRMQNIDNQVNQTLAGVWQQKEQNFGKASQAAAQDLYNAKNPGVKDLQNAVDSVIDQTSDPKNLLEKVNLKKLVGTQGTDVATPKSFVQNLINSDSDTIDSVYEHLGAQAGGDKMIKGVRDAMVQEFFARSADPKTGQFSGEMAGKLLSGTGDFNADKLDALFGRGKEGTQGANSFSRFVSDLKTLGEQQPSPTASNNPYARVAKMIAYPTAILYPLAHGNLKGAAGVAAIEAGMYGLGKVASLPRMVDMVVNDSKFADAFHSWAAAGGDMQAMRFSPYLANKLDKNSSKY